MNCQNIIQIRIQNLLLWKKMPKARQESKNKLRKNYELESTNSTWDISDFNIINIKNISLSIIQKAKSFLYFSDNVFRKYISQIL